MAPQKADLLITNGTVLTVDAENRIIENAAVAVCDDIICDAAPLDFFSDWEVTRVIDAHGGLIMPGLINVHTHAAMTCMRGLADDLPLMTWLNDHVFPAEATLDQSKVYTGSLLACAEMILSRNDLLLRYVFI